ELRRLLPEKYPIRYYPDITHNLRCEIPVHFDRNDWHYAFAAALGRESVNPRPTEYRRLQRIVRPYCAGSVTYSEGVNDDVNKIVWADADFNALVPVRETLLDYARSYMWDIPAEKIADGIMGLEFNWYGAPEDDPCIETTLALFEDIRKKYPSSEKNWRFELLLLRAECDALIRRRRIFEKGLIEDAKKSLRRGEDVKTALKILSCSFNDEYKKLRDDISNLAEILFNSIGIQLDIEHYDALNWERGAILETIDLPITDRSWLINRLNFAETLGDDEKKSFIKGLLARNKVAPDEFYFSVAEDGLDALNVTQDGDYYIDVQGDRPYVNNGTLPTSQFKIYDHYSLKCKLAGFSGDTDYLLKLTHKKETRNDIDTFKITVNGNVIYFGKMYGGEGTDEFDRYYSAPGSETSSYLIPSSAIENGCIALEITEPQEGFKLYEMRIVKK
ncbi:MAG: hypothetical protein K6F09_08440, partial [Clostridiales bacterium]|nr:hypothetical protein [Clostridiales bacterium]